MSFNMMNIPGSYNDAARMFGTSTPKEAEDNYMSKIVSDSGDDAISKLANDLNIKLSSETKDYLMNYYLSEKSANNEFSRQMYASDTSYQRAVKDLQAAGLNPFLAISSLSGASIANGAGNSYSGGYFTSKENEKISSSKDVGVKIFGVLAIIAAAFIHALL